MFCSDSDSYVPVAESDRVADMLDAETMVIKDGGHLKRAAGFGEFSALFDRLRPLL